MTDHRDTVTGKSNAISPPRDLDSVSIAPTASAPSLPDTTAKIAAPNEPATGSTLKFAAESHEYVREYIRNADQKAIFYFSVCSALLAFEHTQGWGRRWLKAPLTWSAVELLTCVAMLTLAVAASLFLYTVLPRLGGSPRGFIFFKAISAYESADAYISDVIKRTEADLAVEKLRHTYELASVASSKYATLNLGLRVGTAGIVCSLLLLLAVMPT